MRESRRVLQVEVVIQPEVDEAEHGGVELHKDGHELEVHALGRVVGVLRSRSVSIKLSQFQSFPKCSERQLNGDADKRPYRCGR